MSQSIFSKKSVKISLLGIYFSIHWDEDFTNTKVEKFGILEIC